MRTLLLLTVLAAFSPCYASDSRAELIGGVDDASVAPIISALEDTDSGSTLVLVIDSPGGSVGAGLELIREMKRAQRRGVSVVCVVDGTAASMAALVLQVCDVRGVTPGSVILFHRASSGCEGNASEMKRCVATLEEWDRMLAILASAKLRISLEEYLKRVDGKDWILSPQEAVALGAADAVVK